MYEIRIYDTCLKTSSRALSVRLVTRDRAIAITCWLRERDVAAFSRKVK